MGVCASAEPTPSTGAYKIPADTEAQRALEQKLEAKRAAKKAEFEKRDAELYGRRPGPVKRDDIKVVVAGADSSSKPKQHKAPAALHKSPSDDKIDKKALRQRDRTSSRIGRNGADHTSLDASVDAPQLHEDDALAHDDFAPNGNESPAEDVSSDEMERGNSNGHRPETIDRVDDAEDSDKETHQVKLGRRQLKISMQKAEPTEEEIQKQRIMARRMEMQALNAERSGSVAERAKSEKYKLAALRVKRMRNRGKALVVAGAENEENSGSDN